MHIGNSRPSKEALGASFGAAWFWAICLMLVLGWPCSLSAQIDVKALERDLKSQPLGLRSFSADPVAHYQWTDGKLVDEPSRIHSLGVFTTDSVKLKDDKLTIKGFRSTLLKDSKAQKVFVSGKSPMRLEIVLGGADASTVISSLRDGLFFLDIKSATDALPPQVKPFLPFELGERTPPKGEKSEFVFDAGAWSEVTTKNAEFTLPKVLHTVEPEYSREGRSERVSSLAVIAFLISATGKVEDLWLARAAGFGLDESAEVAVSKYSFAPAQLNGHAVGMELCAEVKFEIF